MSSSNGVYFMLRPNDVKLFAPAPHARIMSAANASIRQQPAAQVIPSDALWAPGTNIVGGGSNNSG